MPRVTSYRFFFAHAGYSYGPGETPEQGRRRCAFELAKAERRASEAGWSFAWMVDPHMDSSDWDERPRAIAKADAYALWGCIARDQDGEARASLWGIDFGRDGEPWGSPYRRVVEAELALEGLSS